MAPLFLPGNCGYIREEAFGRRQTLDLLATLERVTSVESGH